MARIGVVGCGHVGLVVAASFAKLGHEVLGIDTDSAKVEALRGGACPIPEPELDAMLSAGRESGRLTFRDRYPRDFDVEFVFIAVGTPASTGGASDLRAVYQAVKAVAPTLRPGTVVVNKSTVPVGTCDVMRQLASLAADAPVSVVSNPEFLQEGDAVRNFLEPDRIVLGSDDPDAIERVAALYEEFDAPIVRADLRTAEMIKYASNTFLATKVSFINEMASICEVVGADVTEVAIGMGFDPRIGDRFLQAGIGWGGSCFPKDVMALEHTASIGGMHPQLLRDVVEINRDQRRQVLRKLRDTLGSIERRRIVVLGAAFKPHTSDTRDSPALEVADLLQLSGADVVVYDPHVSPESVTAQFPQLTVADDLLEAARDADALVLATAWPEFQELPLDQLARVMRVRLIIDGRNALDAGAVSAAGFAYRCIGRPALEGGSVPHDADFDGVVPMRLVAVGREPALATER